MGISIDSSNFALPTSRLIQSVKKYLFKRRKKFATESHAEIMKQFYKENLGPDRRGKLGASFRLFYRLSEECFRQVISWFYQLKGDLVLYDRHFLFDFYCKSKNIKNKRFSERVHIWFLKYLYPKPDLVIFLDAPPEVLFQRKGEYSIDYLKEKREKYLYVGKSMKHFVGIDATQPVNKVFSDVTREIAAYLKSKNFKINFKPHTVDKQKI